MNGPVLIVDDDDDIREVISGLLLAKGFRVVAAADGMEALAQLRSGEPPSLILLDLMMPNLSGAEFRARQLADPKLAAIPVVVLSGVGDLDEAGDKLGVEAIGKPIELSLLLETVTRYCAVKPR